MSKDVVDKVLNAVQKKYGKESATTFDPKDSVQIERIPSGSLSVDLAIGGGYPKGRITEVYGPESSGKTTLAIHAGVECQKQGGVVGYVDMENAFDPFYAKQVGLDVENQFVFSQPDSGEQALDILDTMIRNGVNMVILDSVAAMVPQAELDGDYGESKMGLQARLMSQGMRKLVGAIKKNDVIAIFINQIRMKIGVMFGNPETTTGGNALKFYSSIRLDIRRIGQEKEGEEVIANKTRVKVVKNKTYPPFKQAEFFIEFGIGIDRLGELLDKAVDLDIVNKKGSWFAYDGTNIGQGRSKTLEMLKDNEELVDSIEQQVLDKIHI